MIRVTLGIKLESLGLPVRRGLEAAAMLGVAAVEMDAVGPLAPQELSHTGRRDLCRLLAGLGLRLAALGCPLRHGFDTADRQEARLAHVRQVMQLAADLGAGLALVDPGRLPEEPADAVRGMVLDCLGSLGRHGERIGASLVLASAREKPATWLAALRQLDSGALGVLLDPAAALARGDDPVEAVRTLHAFALHAHARDVRVGGSGGLPREVPLGHGDVDWMTYLATLEEVGYRRAFIICSLASGDPLGAAREEIGFLRRFVGA